MNKSELRNVVRSAVKDFIHAHPDALEPKWIESVTKRVTGQIFCHFVHNKKKDGEVIFEEVREIGNSEPVFLFSCIRPLNKEENEYYEEHGHLPPTHSGSSI